MRYKSTAHKQNSCLRLFHKFLKSRLQAMSDPNVDVVHTPLALLAANQVDGRLDVRMLECDGEDGTLRWDMQQTH